LTGYQKFRILICLCLLMLFCVSGFGKYSDEFLLGTYSYLSNSSRLNLIERQAMCERMKELGYNSNLVETTSEDPDLEGLLKDLDSYGLDAWISDRSWSNDVSDQRRYAPYSVSISSYTRFEAEFSSEDDVRTGDALDDKYWYAARSTDAIKRIGKAVPDPDASLGYTWEADSASDKPGFIFTDLRYRWPNINGAYVRIGTDFRFYQKNKPNYEDCYLWIKFRYKISDIAPDLDPQDTLLVFSAAGYELVSTGFSTTPRDLALYNGDTLDRIEPVRVCDLVDSPNSYNYKELQTRIPYADLIAANLLTADLDNDPSTAPSASSLKLINLNPRVFWTGKCAVCIDYVEFEDQLHHDFKSDPGLWTEGIGNRMRSLINMGNGNVSGFYTFDEPYVPQYARYGVLQDIALQNNAKIFTATYDYQAGNMLKDKLRNIRYNHINAFREIAKPMIIVPDIYPILTDVEWNSRKSGKPGMFLQDFIESKVLPVYRECKQYRDLDSKWKFYPIVQTFGNWQKRSDKERWNTWIHPPTATQKALLYLPLCYGADGVFHYRLRSYQSAAGYGDRAVLNSRQGTQNYPVPEIDPITWAAVSSTNPRVLKYGKIIQDLQWLDAATIGTGNTARKSWMNSSLLKSIRVQRTGSGEYEGYIQCAAYLDGGGLPWFMLVNRRGNYFKPGKITSPVEVPDSLFDQYFVEADAQKIRFRFSVAAEEKLSSHLALYDPIDKVFIYENANSISISIPAGEGRLLSLVGTLPHLITGIETINGIAYAQGDITASPQATLVVASGAKLVLLPGTKLRLGSQSQLQLTGKIVLMGDAEMLFEGNGDVNSR
jgi:hypothetical protein